MSPVNTPNTTRPVPLASLRDSNHQRHPVNTTIVKSRSKRRLAAGSMERSVAELPRTHVGCHRQRLDKLPLFSIVLADVDVDDA